MPLLDTGDTLLQEMGVEDSGRDSAASLREEILVKADENQQKQVFHLTLHIFSSTTTV